MSTENHLDPEFQEPEDNEKLKEAIGDYLEYNPELEKLFPVPASTVHNFYRRFISNTYRKFIEANPEANPKANRAFFIRVKLLKELIKIAPEAKYVKITLVQIPDHFTPQNPNLQMANNAMNLYFLFTLADAHNKPHHCGYFDINSFNDSIIPISVNERDVALCLDEFHNVDKKKSLKKALLEASKTKTNTEHIYVNRKQLQNNFLNLYKPKGITNIALVFCEIDIEDKATNAKGYKPLIDRNDKQFGCLWVGISKTYEPLDAPVYDFNSLCPNMCPEE